MDNSLDILEIKDQRLNLLVADFYICGYCKIVDRDDKRGIVGHPCSNCGKPSPDGMWYFPVQIHSLINLMQEQYHLQPPTNTQKRYILEAEEVPTHQIAVIILFCTLWEVLIDHFLVNLMSALKLPESVAERLLADHKYRDGRIGKLFPSLTGDKWADIMAELTSQSELDFIETEKFYLRVRDARNEFLHKGNSWAIAAQMPEQCLRNLWPSLSLFVSLHNHYVPGMYRENSSRNP